MRFSQTICRYSIQLHPEYVLQVKPIRISTFPSYSRLQSIIKLSSSSNLCLYLYVYMGYIMGKRCLGWVQTDYDAQLTPKRCQVLGSQKIRTRKMRTWLKGAKRSMSGYRQLSKSSKITMGSQLGLSWGKLRKTRKTHVQSQSSCLLVLVSISSATW